MKLSTKILTSSIVSLALLAIFILVSFLLLSELRQATIKQQFVYRISEISFQLSVFRNDYALYQAPETEKKLIETANVLSVTLDEAAPLFLDAKSNALFDDVRTISLEIQADRATLLKMTDQGESKDTIKEFSESLGIKVQQRASYMNALLVQTNAEVAHILRLLVVTIVILGLVLLSTALYAYFVVNIIVFKIRLMSSGTKNITDGNLEYQIPSSGHDELATLASSFNIMTAKLRDSYVSLEQKVQERTKALTEKTEDLERLSESMVGRELKMIELKEKISQLTK